MYIITCKHCRFEVRGGRNYQKHMLKAHRKYMKKLRCETCGSEFAGEKSLKVHVAKHNPKIDHGKFKCEYCLIYMTQKHSLPRHIMTLHNELDAEKTLTKVNGFMQDNQVISKGEVMKASLSVVDSQALELFEKLVNTE